MEGFTNVGRTTDLGERRPAGFSLEGTAIVVVRVGDSVFAFENNCPHQHFSLLHQGTVDECAITCPMHGWTFDMETGKATNGNGSLRKRAVRIVEGWLWVETDGQQQELKLFDHI